VRKSLPIISLIILLAISLPLAQAQGEIIRLEKSRISIWRGSSESVTIYVGEDSPGMSITLMVSDLPEFISVSIEPDHGVTPFTSTMRIDVCELAPPGEYVIHVEAWSGEILLESIPLTVEVKAFQPPYMGFTSLKCPGRVEPRQSFTVTGEFFFHAAQETSGRLLIYIDNVLKAQREFMFSGEGNITFTANLTAPGKEEAMEVKAVLQYYDPVIEKWVTADSRSCTIAVERRWIEVEVRVEGLPEDAVIRVQVFTIESPSCPAAMRRGNASLDRPFIARFEGGPCHVSLMVQREVMVSSSTKYVGEGPEIILIQPYSRGIILYTYNPWHLLRRNVEPYYPELEAFSSDRWFSEGAEAEIEVPQIVQTPFTRYVLKRILVDGEEFEKDEITMDSPHNVTYVFERYLKVVVETEPEDPELGKLVGERWIKEGENLTIPFTPYEVGEIRYVPLDASSRLGSELKIDLEEGVIEVTSPIAGDNIELIYGKEALVRVEAAYDQKPSVEILREWVRIGDDFEADLSWLTRSRRDDIKIEVVDIVSESEYTFMNGVLRSHKIDGPTDFLIKLRRSYLIRNLGAVDKPEIKPDCTCSPPCKWNSVDGVLEAWASEGTILTCNFKSEYDLKHFIYRFEEGRIGDLLIEEPGPAIVQVDSPLNISFAGEAVDLYRLEGKTPYGVFYGAETYREGSRVYWWVEPTVKPFEGFAGTLGFFWQVKDAAGQVVMDSDKEIDVEWEPGVSPINPLIIILESICMAATGYLAWQVSRPGPCADMAGMRRRLIILLGKRDELLGELERLRKEIEKLNMKIMGDVKALEEKQKELDDIEDKIGKLDTGKLSYGVAISGEKIVVSISKRAASLLKLERKMKNLRDEVTSLRRKIVEEENDLIKKFKELDQLWNRLQKLLPEVESLTSKIYQCEEKLAGGPCYDLPLIKRRIKELDDLLRIVEDLKRVSLEDLSRIKDLRADIQEDLDRERRFEAHYRDLAKRLRERKPRSWIERKRDGFVLTDLDLELLRNERRNLVVRYELGELSSEEFRREWERLSAPIKPEVMEELRKKMRDLSDEYERRADESHGRILKLMDLRDDLEELAFAESRRIEDLDLKIIQLKRMRDEALKKLEKCEQKFADCRWRLSLLKSEIETVKRSYSDKLRERRDEARKALESIEKMEDETREILGEFEELSKKIKKVIEKIDLAAGLKRAVPKAREILETETPASTIKTIGDLGQQILELIKDIGKKVKAPLPNPIDYLEPAVKGVAGLYVIMGEMLDPYNPGAWLRRALGEEEPPEEILQRFNRFSDARARWPKDFEKTLRDLNEYLYAVYNSLSDKSAWSKAEKCLSKLPDRIPDTELLQKELEDALKEAEKVDNLRECEKAEKRLKEILEKLRRRARELHRRCDIPNIEYIELARSYYEDLKQDLDNLRRDWRDLTLYLENVKKYIRTLPWPLGGG